MTPFVITMLVIGGVLLLLSLWLIGIYNSLVQGRNQAQNAWSQIDVQLKRRHDLIPNLVEAVKGYAGHERGTLEAVVAARGKAVAATDMGQRVAAEGQLTQALGRLMVLVESYPQLKANENFMGLQEELSSTENRIGFARQNYNDNAMGYNTRIQSFPQNLLAEMFGFHAAPFFEIDNKADAEVPQVKF